MKTKLASAQARTVAARRGPAPGDIWLAAAVCGSANAQHGDRQAHDGQELFRTPQDHEAIVRRGPPYQVIAPPPMAETCPDANGLGSYPMTGPTGKEGNPVTQSTPQGRATSGESQLPSFDPSVPNPARMWNYWLGGKDNFAADREAAERVLQVMPSLPLIARAARLFLIDAVHQLADRHGIRQFLDIGTGLPTADNTHDVAQIGRAVV